jgi:hypothetical protein
VTLLRPILVTVAKLTAQRGPLGRPRFDRVRGDVGGLLDQTKINERRFMSKAAVSLQPLATALNEQYGDDLAGFSFTIAPDARRFCQACPAKPSSMVQPQGCASVDERGPQIEAQCRIWQRLGSRS